MKSLVLLLMVLAVMMITIGYHQKMQESFKQEKIIEYRAGEDFVEGTPDDVIFTDYTKVIKDLDEGVGLVTSVCATTTGDLAKSREAFHSSSVAPVISMKS